MVHLVLTPGPSTHPGDKVSMSFRGSGLFAKGKVQIMGLDEMGFEVSIRKNLGARDRIFHHELMPLGDWLSSKD